MYDAYIHEPLTSRPIDINGLVAILAATFLVLNSIKKWHKEKKSSSATTNRFHCTPFNAQPFDDDSSVVLFFCDMCRECLSSLGVHLCLADRNVNNILINNYSNATQNFY